MSAPVISIITVVYNSESLIERTIQSVLNQTFKSTEHIIIDGRSKDNTVKIIERYSTQIAYWISEPDKGLYDAMNKGLAVAKGEYVCFLNSGDTFYDANTLENVFGNLVNSPDIIYGETMIVDSQGIEIGLRRLKAPEVLTWQSFKDGMLVCHQSVYVKRALTSNYNLQYKISADFEWVLTSLKKAKEVHNTRLILTKFLDGGINKKNIRRGLTERFIIMSKHYGFIPTLFRHLLIGLKFFSFYSKNKRF